MSPRPCHCFRVKTGPHGYRWLLGDGVARVASDHNGDLAEAQRRWQAAHGQPLKWIVYKPLFTIAEATAQVADLELEHAG